MPGLLGRAWLAAAAAAQPPRRLAIPACPCPRWPGLQYFLVKDESVDVEELLVSLAPNLPVSLDGGI